MCDSCSAATIGTAGAYSGLAASKSATNHKSERSYNNNGITKRTSPIGIVLVVIIVVILLLLVIWLIISFFLYKKTKHGPKKDQSCLDEPCVNSSDCEPGLICSNGICISN